MFWSSDTRLLFEILIMLNVYNITKLVVLNDFLTPQATTCIHSRYFSIVVFVEMWQMFGEDFFFYCINPYILWVRYWWSNLYDRVSGRYIQNMTCDIICNVGRFPQDESPKFGEMQFDLDLKVFKTGRCGVCEVWCLKLKHEHRFITFGVMAAR